MSEYSPDELLFIAASRMITDGDVVVVGSGIALVVATLAQRMHAPGVCIVVDSGAVDPQLRKVPQSVSEARIAHRTLQQGSMREVLGPLLHRGGTVALLGAAEIDRFGNVNSSYVRGGNGEMRRLVGSGGATAMLACAARVIIPVRHELRRFPDQCAYVSSPGYLSGSSARIGSGLHEPSPDFSIVTDVCVMQANKESGRLTVTALMPGRTLPEVFARTGFKPSVAACMSDIEPPSAEELRILRDEVDPDRTYLKTAA